MEGNVNMWWLVSAVVIVVFLALMSSCDTAKEADKQSEELYLAMHKEDKDGDN